MSKAGDALREAAGLVDGERDRCHGSKVGNFGNIARLWSAYLNRHITAKDVALMMTLLKVARTKSGAHNADDYIDMAGYAGCGLELAEWEERNSYGRSSEIS